MTYTLPTPDTAVLRLTFTGAQVQQLTGLTGRMLVYWLKMGYYEREADGWLWTDIQLLSLMRQLVDRGCALRDAHREAKLLYCQLLDCTPLDEMLDAFDAWQYATGLAQPAAFDRLVEVYERERGGGA